MPVSNLQQLFEHEVQDLHSAETQIIAALPKMIAAASDEKLQAALEDHLEVTRTQLERLESIAEDVGFKKSNKECVGIKGIIAEGEMGLKEITDSATKDAAIIASAQRVEHYEIAGYGTAAEFASKLGHDEAADLLGKTLEEEKQADSDLNGLAKGGLFSEGLNEEAMKE